MTETTQHEDGQSPLDIGVGFDVLPGGGGQDLTEQTSWERTVDSVFSWVPYATLAVSTVLAQLGDKSTEDRAWSLGIAVIAAVWTWSTFTRSGEPTQQSQASLRIYFTGFVVIAAVAMFHDPVFVVYAITGFLHASLLRPWPLAFAGLAITAMIVFSTIVYPGGGLVEWLIYLGLVAFQTAAVGFGLYAGERLMEIASDRRKALEHLERARIENEGLHAQLVEQAREAGMLDERQRLAREIHDTIAQDLTGVITQIEAVRQNWGNEAEMQRHLESAADLARVGLAEARRSVHDLRPVDLEGHELPDAVQSSVERWSIMNDTRVEFTVVGQADTLSRTAETALLRATQEALANVARHAAATRVAVTLTYLDDAVALDVRDNGVGFDVEAGSTPESYGLIGMTQRVSAIGGAVDIESSSGSGTAVSVRVPKERTGADRAD